MRGAWRRPIAAAGLLLSTVAILRGADDTTPVVPVAGPSQLHRIRLSLQETSMGSTGRWGPPPEHFAPAIDRAPRLAPFTVEVTLSGADLYRLDCRGCHRADGRGQPPEINTLIDPVQGTSLALWEQRMKQLGRPVDPVFDRQVVAGARADLLNRLVHGGEKMPPFEFLSDTEVQALVGYLDVLADLPEAPPAGRVSEPALRVGEHLVKGTCHICHDATGPWPTPQQLLDGAIPPLADLPVRLTLPEIIQKVRRGAPIEMGLARVPSRGRMPVFDYLTDDEVAAAYFYLMVYPPQP